MRSKKDIFISSPKCMITIHKIVRFISIYLYANFIHKFSVKFSKILLLIRFNTLTFQKNQYWCYVAEESYSFDPIFCTKLNCVLKEGTDACKYLSICSMFCLQVLYSLKHTTEVHYRKRIHFYGITSTYQLECNYCLSLHILAHNAEETVN